MATARGGLSDEQVGQLREDLAAGKYPRVRISAAQFGGASAGTVRKVGDPVRDGEDFLTVRVTVSGVTDDLRFGPRELFRGRATSAEKAAAAPKTPTTPRPRQQRLTERTPKAKPVSASAAAVASRKTARRSATGAPVSIALASAGSSWTVSAQRGARSVVKSAPVNPGVVSSIAALLNVPGLEDAVAAVNDTARAEAETRAEQLRSELARVQAVLDSHRRP